MSSLVELAFQRCLSHWGGEFAIALRYFQRPASLRPAPRERSWLQFQIWKEWYGSGVYGPRGITVQDVLRDALEKIHIPRPGGTDLATLTAARQALDFGRDEFAHFTDLLDLWQQTFPGEAPAVATWGDMPAGQALTEHRYQLREDPLGELAVRLSEGGGLGLFFGIQHILDNDDITDAFDQRLLRAVQRILSDERGHLIGNFVGASRTLSAQGGISRVVDLLDQVCATKLAEREAQFDIQVTDLPPGFLQAACAQYRARYLLPLRSEIFHHITHPEDGPHAL